MCARPEKPGGIEPEKVNSQFHLISASLGPNIHHTNFLTLGGFLALTKTGSWFNSMQTPGKKPIAAIGHGVAKAEGMGLGPVSLGLTGMRVYSGDVSLGGAAAGAATGGLAYKAIDKAAKKPMAALASKLPAKLLTRLPGWMGTAAKIAVPIIGSGVAAEKAEKVVDKVAPLWRKKPAPIPFPTRLTPDQLSHLRTMVRSSAAMSAGMQQ
jgi:hypothetical protein